MAINEFFVSLGYIQDCSRHTIRQGLDDDDTPGTSVVEKEYAFGWQPGLSGRVGFGPRGSSVAGSSPADGSGVQWLNSYWIDRLGIAGGGAGADPTATGADLLLFWRYATVGYFPASGGRNAGSGAPVTVAASGDFRSSGRHATDARYVSLSWFNATGFNATGTANRADGLSVRCVQEEVTNAARAEPSKKTGAKTTSIIP